MHTTIHGRIVGGNLTKMQVQGRMPPGAIEKGIAAAILSHGKMPLTSLPVGSPTDLRMERTNFHGLDGKTRLRGLLRSFVALKSNMLTLTIEDTEILRQAQKHSEDYPDLRVRMGGWSAYFTMLSKEQQDHQDHHIQKAGEL